MVHEPSHGEEDDLGDHGEDLIGGWIEDQSDDWIHGGPLAKVLHQEESLGDIHPG